LRENNDLVAYITHLADKLTVEDQLLKHEGVLYRTFPALKIGFLAADKRTKGADKLLMELALDYVAANLSPNVGIRFVTVDALYDADSGYDVSGYYQHIGFQYATPAEQLPPIEAYRTMFFDLKPLIDSI
jgi:hypothetical protein